MSTMLSENVEAEKINKANTRTEHRNIVLSKANEISHDLYNFKMRSREIQLKIQNDINTFKLYTDVRSLEELSIQKEDYLEKILNAFNDLKLDFKEVATVIAEVRKLSNPENSSNNSTELNKRDTCKKLQALTNSLFCKSVHVKWIYELFKTERTKRKTIASSLIMYLQQETLEQPESALREKHGSLSEQTLSLSDAISEMNKMIGKPSFPFADEVSVSKRQISNEKQQPLSVPGTNIHSETKPQDTGLPSNPNASLYAANQMTSNNFSFNVPRSTKTSEPLSSFKFEPPISRPLEIQTESIHNETNKLQANSQLPNLSRAAPILNGTFSVKFRPTIEVIQVDVDGVTKYVSLFNRCITMMKEYENQSLEELRLADYFLFRHQPFGALHVNENLFFKGTTSVEFTPPIELVQGDVDGVTKQVLYFNNCITMMKVYESQSLEELRLADYFLFGVFGHQQYNHLFGSFHRNLLTKDFKALDAIHVKFHPTYDITTCEKNEKEADKFQCITFMNEFKNQSFEELRLSDYKIVGVFPPETLRAHGMGTARVIFIPPTDTDVNVISTDTGTVQNIEVKYQYITSIKEFENKSLEELRLEDYIAGRRGPTLSVFKSQQHSSNLQNSDSKSPTNKSQSPGNSRNTPSQSRDTPTQSRDLQSPTQKEETAKQDCGTSTQYWEILSTNKLRVSDENAAAAEILLKDGKTEEAIKMSSDALKLDPENVFFLVYRARAYYELKQYREALEDAQKADSLSPNLPAIGYLNIAKCCLALGHIAPSEQAVRRAVERDPSVEVKELREAFESLRTNQETVHRCMSQTNYIDAVYVIDRNLKRFCPASSMMKLLKAECLAHLRKYGEVRSIVLDLSLMKTNAQSRDAVYADSMYVTGLCSYYQENDELAIKHFRKVLENDPDHKKAIKMFKLTKTRMNNKLLKQKEELGNKAFNAGEWKKAMDFYDEALSIDKSNKEENAKLHYNRATVFAKQNQIKNAIKACTAALELDGNYIKALLKRAQCYREIDMYEESLDDYEKLYYIDSTKENELLLNAANSALKANRCWYYYYKVLGIDKTATQDDIKKAYRKCALRHHPDKHASASLAEVRKNERKFKLMKEAYDILSDPTSRDNYDRNQNRSNTTSKK